MTQEEVVEVLTCYFTDVEKMDEGPAILKAMQAASYMFSESTCEPEN